MHEGPLDLRLVTLEAPNATALDDGDVSVPARGHDDVAGFAVPQDALAGVARDGRGGLPTERVHGHDVAAQSVDDADGPLAGTPGA